ncbi:MAG: glycosyltransferase [Bacteroidota bacterium]
MTVVSCAGEGFFSEFASKSFDGYLVRSICRTYDEYKEKRVTGRLWEETQELLNELSPDVVAIPGWASCESFAALNWCRENGVPTILMSESQKDDADRSKLKETLKSLIVSQFDTGFAGGESSRDYLNQLGLQHKDIMLGYNAVDNEHFSIGAANARTKRRRLIEEYDLPQQFLLASCRFIEKKNLVRLIEAYAQAKRKNAEEVPDLVILGNGTERDKVVEKAVELNIISNVHLHGFRSYDALPTYYGLSRGFIHIATHEQWGLVINEAMASGTPVIASSRCGATRTLLADNEAGFVVDPFDVGEISESITSLCQLSAGSRSTMIAKSQEIVSAWGSEKFGSGMYAAALRAIELPRKPPLKYVARLFLERLARRQIGDVT